MKLGMIITQTDPETVFNALRLALYSLEQGDDVRIFLSGKKIQIELSGTGHCGVESKCHKKKRLYRWQ